jgi:hypothetical protein
MKFTYVEQRVDFPSKKSECKADYDDSDVMEKAFDQIYRSHLAGHSDPHFLILIERHLVVASVVELCGTR